MSDMRLKIVPTPTLKIRLLQGAAGPTGAAGAPGAAGADGAPGPQGPPGTGATLADGDYGDIVVSGVGTAINIDSAILTAAGRAIIDDADATAQRSTLGLVIGTNVQAQDAELAAIAGLTSAADRLPYFTGLGTASLATFTAAGRAIIDDADATAQRSTLGLVIGTNVQAQDAELAAIAGLTSAADRLPYFTGLGTASLATFTAAGRAIIDDADATAQLATLGAVAYTAQTLTAAQQQIARTNIGAPLKGHIFGLTLSNNGADANNDIDIAAGQCASTETNPVLLVLASAITKRLDAVWAVGTNQGGLDTGTKAVSTWYYIWVIRRSDTGVTDTLFSLSSTAPTMPTNYDQKRRIGAVRTDGSGNILAFSQSSDEFLLSTSIGDVNAVQGTTAALYTLTVPPIGGVRVKFNIGATGAAGLSPLMLVSSPDQADQTVNSPVGNGTVYSPVVATSNFLGSSPVRTVSGQVRIRAANAGGNIYIVTFGWTDERGQYGNP